MCIRDSLKTEFGDPPDRPEHRAEVEGARIQVASVLGADGHRPLKEAGREGRAAYSHVVREEKSFVLRDIKESEMAPRVKRGLRRIIVN